MRKLSLVAAATVSLFVLSGAPAAYATDLPDIPTPISLPSTVTAAAGVGYSAECDTKSSIVRGEENGIAARYCVYHQVDQVWGTFEFAAPEYGNHVQLFYDLITYRCRQSDNVCVEIASRKDQDPYTNTAGAHSDETARTTQTWAGRYYKTCLELSTSINWGFSDCTLHLVP